MASGDNEALSGCGFSLGPGGCDEPGPLGHHHEGGRPLRGHLVFEARGHRLEVSGNLGDEDDVGTDGDSGLKREPAGLLAQDLDDANLARGLRRLPDAVEHLNREAERAVEAERHRCRGDVVLE